MCYRWPCQAEDYKDIWKRDLGIMEDFNYLDISWKTKSAKSFLVDCSFFQKKMKGKKVAGAPISDSNQQGRAG